MAQNSSNSMEIVKTLSSKPRLEALLLLFIYRKISLTDLSERLHKTKNTMIYHMRLLKEHGLITEFDRKIPGSIKPIKVYQLKPDFYKKLYVPFEDISKLPQDQVMEHSKTIFRYNMMLFETIREILSRIQTFYDSAQKEANTLEKVINFHENHSIPRDLIPLSEAAYKEYQDNYGDLIRKTLRFLEEEDETSPEVERPYLAFNSILPIKDIFEEKSKPSI
ncbi:MAG: hypothetical protein ACTSRK_12090 [Promethearchaeota archaeon]